MNELSSTSLGAAMNRRNFVRVAGGGAIAAAGLPGCSLLSSDYPSASVEAWAGPGDEADPRRRAVAYAITAPNPHNLQPWLVDLREPGVVMLYADRARLLPETDPFGRQILIGHGAFLELMVIALAHQGISCQVLLWPQGELPADMKGWDERPVARLVLSAESAPTPYTSATASLFPHILLRRTPKTPFDPSREITADTLKKLTEGASTADVSLGATVDAARLPALRELCWQAGRQELLTPRTMMESQRLMRVGPEEILAHRDGIVLNTSWMRAVSTLGLFDRTQPPVRGSAAYDAGMSLYDNNSRTATGFVWLGTAGNSRREQVLAGRVFVRLQLKATELGVGMHPMSQALQEFPEMQRHYDKAHRLMLGRAAPQSWREPTLQMFCRLGYPERPAPATPRRPLEVFMRTV
jgi:hypothetical protein